MTTDPLTHDHRLAAIGDAIERAVTADLAGSHGGAATSMRWRPRRRAALLGVAALILIPGAAIATTQLLWSDSQVAASLPQGTLALGGTDPTCTTVVANVEYHCTLTKPPSTVGAPGAQVVPPGAQVVPSGAQGVAPAGTGVRLSHAKLAALARLGIRVVVLDHHVIAFAKHRHLIHLRTAAVSATSVSPPTAGSADWLGTVEPTVDSRKRVNGGCRALNTAGTEWECYIGGAAVAQKIISQGFLGQYAPSPGVG